MSIITSSTFAHLFNKLGFDATLISQTPSANYDPSNPSSFAQTATNISVRACQQNFGYREKAASSLIKDGDVKIYVSASGLSTEPKIGDKITYTRGSITYTFQIVEVQRKTVNGDVVAFMCHSRS